MEQADEVIRNVGRRIRELRLRREWTQEEMAEKLNIALRNFQQMERGRQNLTLRTMVRLARLLGVRTIRLMEEPESTDVPRGRPTARKEGSATRR